MVIALNIFPRSAEKSSFPLVEMLDAENYYA